VLRGDDLVGSLAGSEGSFRIAKEEISLETAVSLFPNMPYKLSLNYRVGPVYVESTRVKPTARVRERQVSLKQK